MPHTIIHNPQEHYLEMKAWGSLMMDEAGEIISELLQAVKENNCPLILSDYRQATMDLSVAEIYLLPNKIAEKASSMELSGHKIKRALVAEEGSQNFHFFETVTVNRGQPTKLFSTMDEAKKWLLQK